MATKPSGQNTSVRKTNKSGPAVAAPKDLNDLANFDLSVNGGVGWNTLETKFYDLNAMLSAPTSGLNANQARLQQKQMVSIAIGKLLDLAQQECRRLLVEGNAKAAVEGGLKTLKLKEDYYGAGSLQLVPSYFHMARTNQYMDKFKAAEEFLSLAQWTILKHPDADVSLKAELHQTFGLLYASDSKLDAALKQLTCATYYLSMMNGPSHILTSFGYFDLGNVFAAKSSMENAMAFYDKVKDIWHGHLNQALKLIHEVQHSETDVDPEAVLKYSTPQAFGEENLQDAVKMLRGIVGLQCERFGRVHPSSGKAEEVLGMFMLWNGDAVSALDSMLRALEVSKRVLGDRHPNTSAIRALLLHFGLTVPEDTTNVLEAVDEEDDEDDEAPVAGGAEESPSNPQEQQERQEFEEMLARLPQLREDENADAAANWTEANKSFALNEIHEVASFAHPPAKVLTVLTAFMKALGEKTQWDHVKTVLKRKTLLHQVQVAGQMFSQGKDIARVVAVYEDTSKPDWPTQTEVSKSSHAVVGIWKWVAALPKGFVSTHPTYSPPPAVAAATAGGSDAEKKPEEAEEKKEEPTEETKQEEAPTEEKQEDAPEEETQEEAPATPASPAKTSKLPVWEELRHQLPGLEKGNAEHKQQRRELFSQFDPNGNGYLSLAEIDAACRKVLKLDEITDDLAPILMRAFTAAKDARKATGKNKKHGDDYVERAEFRLLFVYIYQYFEMWFMFDEIDSGDDRRINLDEFKAASDKIEAWGVPIADAEAQFKAIDTNDGGIILFQEFADWALKRGLDADGEDDSDLDLPDPEKKAAEEKAAAEEEKEDAAEGKKTPQEKDSSKLPVWDDLKSRLPGLEKGNAEHKQQRKTLFRQFDPNGNGYLSLAEVDAHCKKILKLDELTNDLAPILMRAFTAAKDARKARGRNKKHGDDYVERAEFRLLFVYIYQYFELWFMFDEIDSGDDRRINLDEFKAASGKIEAWGVPVADAEAQFKAIDTNDGGIILFQEFADWALKQKLDADGDDSDSDMDLPDAEAKAAKDAELDRLEKERAEAKAKEEAEKPPQASSKLAVWQELREKLPGLEPENPEHKEQRKNLFSQFDPNGNGYLSLAEVDAHCKKVLRLDELTNDLAPILMRAFTAAKDVRKATGKNKKHGDDYVERAEFRLLFVYIYQYFEMWFMFDEIDSGDDRRINLDEFKAASGKIEAWGVPVADAEAQFKAIDTNDGGIILFQEFADWALRKKLDADGSAADTDDESEKKE